MKNISVVIATYNEEKNIQRCLNSIKDLADEIVVVDAKSRDKTVDIAKKFHAKILIIDNSPIFHKNKQFGLDKAEGEWILQLDADEEVTNTLKQEIIKTLKQNKEINGYYIPRRNYFLGKFMNKGGLYPDSVIRLIRKDKGYFPCKSVHEQIQVDGKVDFLKQPLLHYSYPDLTTYLMKANRYTTLASEELFENGVRLTLKNTLIYCLFKPFQTFIDIFIRHGGFIDGFHGLIWAILSGSHYFIAYAKLMGRSDNYEHRN